MQPSLFDVTPPLSPPYAKGSATSKDAAIRAQRFVGQQGGRVAAWFAEQGVQGATQRQCSESIGIARASVAARVNALERDGRLVKTARRYQGCTVYRHVRSTDR